MSLVHVETLDGSGIQSSCCPFLLSTGSYRVGLVILGQTKGSSPECSQVKILPGRSRLSPALRLIDHLKAREFTAPNFTLPCMCRVGTREVRPEGFLEIVASRSNLSDQFEAEHVLKAPGQGYQTHVFSEGSGQIRPVAISQSVDYYRVGSLPCRCRVGDFRESRVGGFSSDCWPGSPRRCRVGTG